MKKLLDLLFRGTVLMAPKWAVIIILMGSLAAVGEQSGLSKPEYTSIGAAGLVLGIISVLYTVKEEAREAALYKAAADLAAANANTTVDTGTQTPPIVVTDPLPTSEV